MTRKALQDFTFSDGTFIPAGTTISAPSHSVHHDGQFYDNPYTFDPFRFARMRDDAARYVPVLRDAAPVASLREVKVVLAAREADDGRPVLVERSAGGRVVHVLGGKLDNVGEAVRALGLEGAAQRHGDAAPDAARGAPEGTSAEKATGAAAGAVAAPKAAAR